MLVAEQVSVRKRQVCILHQLSFVLASPGLYVVMGPNGSGKSTLLRFLAGLETVYTGMCHLGEGIDLATLSVGQRAAYFAYDSGNLFCPFSYRVEEIIALAVCCKGSRSLQLEQVLQLFDLLPLRAQPYLALSQGQQARVQLARTLMQDTRYILWDEPVAHLDVHASYLYLQRARDFALTRGKVIVAVLHDFYLASCLGDGFMVLDKGCMALTGTSAQVFADPRLADIFKVCFVPVGPSTSTYTAIFPHEGK
ncbi:MAG: ABC transporter ATP-binding protein [Zetaproteobacteria bacterium]|nr:ABC transporter ATP-binding protein [Zetaproteobacteria bacterium]